MLYYVLKINSNNKGESGMNKQSDAEMLTRLSSFKDKKRVIELTTFTDSDGHNCENLGRNTLSKMAKQIQSRKKNHARGGTPLGRALSKQPYKTVPNAKGRVGFIPSEKKYLYTKVKPAGRDSVVAELDAFMDKEKKMGMMIGIMNRKRIAGTLECIHDTGNKWTSMRLSDNKSDSICQKCGFKLILIGRTKD